MKTVFARIVLAVGWLGIVGTGLAATTVLMDDFNDGVRNKTLWRVPAGNSGLLLEQNGRLCYATSSGDDAFAAWDWKKVYTLIDRDRLDIVFTLSMPSELYLAGESMKYGVGFRDELAPARQVIFWMEQMNQNRWFNTYVTDGFNASDGLYGPQQYPKKMMLRLRYSNQYKKVSFAYKTTLEASWHVLGGGIDLNAQWGVASHRVLRPFVYAVSTDAFIPPYNYQLDNFTVTCRGLDSL